MGACRSLTADELRVVEELYREYEQEAGAAMSPDPSQAYNDGMVYFDTDEWCVGL